MASGMNGFFPGILFLIIVCVAAVIGTNFRRIQKKRLLIKEKARRKLREVEDQRQHLNTDEFFVKSYLDRRKLEHSSSPPVEVEHTVEHSDDSLSGSSTDTIIKTPEVETNKDSNKAKFVYKGDSKHEIISQNQIQSTNDGQILPSFGTYQATENTDFPFSPSDIPIEQRLTIGLKEDEDGDNVLISIGEDVETVIKRASDGQLLINTLGNDVDVSIEGDTIRIGDELLTVEHNKISEAEEIYKIDTLTIRKIHETPNKEAFKIEMEDDDIDHLINLNGTKFMVKRRNESKLEDELPKFDYLSFQKEGIYFTRRLAR